MRLIYVKYPESLDTTITEYVDSSVNIKVIGKIIIKSQLGWFTYFSASKVNYIMGEL